jgi:transcriptional regulator with XRE-family HTH domain
MSNTIGFKIKKLREQKSISQEDLAHQLNVSQSYLSKIETGAIEKMDFLFMQRVADFFKIEPQYFLDDQIVQNNSDSAVGNIYGSINIHNSISDDLMKNVVKNQEQLSQLMEMQNKLIEKLLKD